MQRSKPLGGHGPFRGLEAPLALAFNVGAMAYVCKREISELQLRRLRCIFSDVKLYSVSQQILWLGVATALACGDSDASGPSVDVVGTWNLITVDGRALPTFVSAGVGVPAVKIESSQIVIRSDGSFTDTYALGSALGSSFTVFQESGTWIRDGRQVTLSYSSNGSSGTGTLDDNLLTMDFDGAWVFRRE